MPIPDFQTLMRPVLEVHQGTGEWERRPLVDELAKAFELSDEDREERIPSGQRRFDNRIAWALTHLFQAGLIERPRRGVTRLTDRGRQVLEQHPDPVDMKTLEEFEEYQEFRSRSTPSKEVEPTPQTIETPEETIDAAYEQVTNALADEVLEKLRGVNPTYFEYIVVDVLVGMGYGGSHQEAREQLGGPGDKGIDGIIREDKLGLDNIYVQAKRWAPDHAVRRPDVQGFVGALQGFQATKGVFITTSRFTDEAREYVRSVAPRVVLIDGRHLARLMVDHDVGVTRRRDYVLKRLDEDYFEESS